MRISFPYNSRKAIAFNRKLLLQLACSAEGKQAHGPLPSGPALNSLPPGQLANLRFRAAEGEQAWQERKRMQECSHRMAAVTVAQRTCSLGLAGCEVDPFSNECLCERLTDSPIAGISLLKLI